MYIELDGKKEYVMELQTKRLILREFKESDFKSVHKYASNLDSIKYMIWGPNSEKDTVNFLKQCIEKSTLEPRLNYDFAITLKESGQLIGGCGIYLNSELNEGMLGWVLHMDYWKQGYGTELAEEIIRFGFENLGLHRIYATCYAENYGSYRVMERNNMRREAHFNKNRMGRIEWVDEVVYGILEEEWRATQQ